MFEFIIIGIGSFLEEVSISVTVHNETNPRLEIEVQTSSGPHTSSNPFNPNPPPELITFSVVK